MDEMTSWRSRSSLHSLAFGLSVSTAIWITVAAVATLWGKPLWIAWLITVPIFISGFRIVPVQQKAVLTRFGGRAGLQIFEQNPALQLFRGDGRPLFEVLQNLNIAANGPLFDDGSDEEQRLADEIREASRLKKKGNGALGRPKLKKDEALERARSIRDTTRAMRIILGELDGALEPYIFNEGLAWVFWPVEEIEIVNLKLRLDRLMGRGANGEDQPPHLLGEDVSAVPETTYPWRVYDRPVAIFWWLSLERDVADKGLNDALLTALGRWVQKLNAVEIRSTIRDKEVIQQIFTDAMRQLHGWFIRVETPNIPDVSFSTDVEKAINRRAIEIEEAILEQTQSDVLEKMNLQHMEASRLRDDDGNPTGPPTITYDMSRRGMQIEREKKGITEQVQTGEFLRDAVRELAGVAPDLVRAFRGDSNDGGGT